MQVLYGYRRSVTMSVTPWSLWDIMTKANPKITVVITGLQSPTFSLSKQNFIF